MPLAVTIVFGFEDNKGIPSSTKIRVPNGFAISDYLEFASAAGQLLANITQARVTRASVCFGIDLSGVTLKAAAASAADAARKAYFQFNTAVSGLRTRMFVPTVTETIIPVGSDAIDTTDPLVAPFVSIMTNGLIVTGGTISPTDDRENDIVSVTTAEEKFR